MASTYSTLKVELIGTGDQTGTWGTTTNDNFSVALGEAITGSADVIFSSADVTVTLTNTNAAQTARNLRLNLTGTSGGARQLILGSGCQIEKLYLINNGLADAVTVKNTSGTGIAVPAGKSMFVFNNGTNVVEAITHLNSLTLGTALTVASGGTGLATLTANNVLIGNGTSNVAFVAPGTSGNVLTSNGTTWASSTPTTPSGRILQIVQSIYTSSTTTNSTSFVTTNHSVSITPSSASSKILLLNTFKLFQTDEFQPSQSALSTIFRGATNLAGGTAGFTFVSSGFSNSIYTSGAINHLDSPNTTSSTTYTAFIRGAGSQPTAVYEGPAMLIALEIL